MLTTRPSHIAQMRERSGDTLLVAQRAAGGQTLAVEPHGATKIALVTGDVAEAVQGKASAPAITGLPEQRQALLQECCCTDLVALQVRQLAAMHQRVCDAPAIAQRPQQVHTLVEERRGTRVLA